MVYSSATPTVFLFTTVLLQQTIAGRCPYGQRFINGFCHRHCSKVCRNIKLPCEPFLDTSIIKNYSSWKDAENVPCFQREWDQITGEVFLRTSCMCPNRTYTNTSNPGALSNCILSEITETEGEINFGRLSWVQLGVVRAEAQDIDFQGNAKRNHICLVDTVEDVEFGSFTKFRYNIVYKMLVGDDLQFEQGAIVGPFNIFGTVNIADEFRFTEDDLTDIVKVIRNSWGNLTIGECDIETEEEPIIRQNTCDAANIDDASKCVTPIAGGLTCITEED